MSRVIGQEKKGENACPGAALGDLCYQIHSSVTPSAAECAGSKRTRNGLESRTQAGTHRQCFKSLQNGPDVVA